MSDSLQPHGVQHARYPSPLPTPGVYSCPLSQWCHPTISSCHLLLLPPSIFPSIRVLSNESVLHIWWPKYWSFNFSISPSNEYLELISFRMDWPDQTIKWPDHWPDLITQIKWTEKGWRIRVKAEVTELNPKLKVDHISTMWDGDPWPSPVQLHEF